MPFDPELQKFAHFFYEPIEGQDMPLIGDGKTYSRALGWQSPEGNFYGQERWVRDWPVAVVWDGDDYRNVEIDGEASSVEDLPLPDDINPATRRPYGPRQHFEIWAIPRPNWPPPNQTVYDARDKEFYYWDAVAQAWKHIEWFWSVDGEENLKRPGIKIGAAHILFYYDIKVMWNGYYWTRYKHSMIEDDEPWLHVPEGFIGSVSQLEDSHNQLLEDFLGAEGRTEQRFTDTVNYVNNQIADVNQAISSLSARIIDYSSDLIITNTEANLLDVTVNQIIAESVELLSVATSLGITEDDTGYQSAITALRVGIAKWINQDVYPLNITKEERIEIQNLLYAVNYAKSKTVEAINTAQRYSLRSYVKDQIAEVSNQIQQINTSFDFLSSDLTITQSEAASLKSLLFSLKAESSDLLAMAAEFGLTSYGNSYRIGLTLLEDCLSEWIDQDTYPLDISLHERGVILSLISEVQDRKTVFTSALTDAKNNRVASYVDNQILEVNEAISALSDGINLFSEDGYITLVEANGLKQVRDSLIAESEELINAAEGLDLDAEAEAFEVSKNALIAGLSDWIDNPPYPKPISVPQREAIQALINDVQVKKAVIIKSTATQAAAAAVVPTQFDIDQFKLVYNGFVRGFTTELKLTYISDSELSLVPDYEEYTYLTVTEQNIAASKSTSVYLATPVLNWNDTTQTFSTTTIQPSYNNYYVYFADRSSGFLLPQADYRGRLFCSTTPPVNNYLGENGLGRNAILAGYVDTNSAGKFIYTYGTSLISRTSDFKEIFRDHSDFDLVYTNETTLTLDQNYGTYGQIYIPESLYFIGIGSARTVKTTSARIELDPSGGIVFDYSAIKPNQLYYCYMAGDLDIYNNNDLGEDDRPLRPGNVDYNEDKDLRLWPFLSKSPPDPISGRLSDSYSGFWTRHIGQVTTDALGKFKYSANVSAIRQKTLDPIYFDGLAEVYLFLKSTYMLYLLRKKGTSGIIMVNGEGVLTHEISDGEDLVHSINISSNSKIYNELEATPLSNGPVISSIMGRNLYIYLCNSNSIWGSSANSLIACTTTQTKGYLSQSFPGNNARWVATIALTPTSFGAELVSNGDFITSSGWTLGSGWSHNSGTKVMEHTSGTASLSQTLSITEGKFYQVGFSLVDCDSGNVTPVLGGTRGDSSSLSGGIIQNLVAGASSLIELSPSTTFTVSVDNISVKEILSGDLSGNYLVEGINQDVSVISDTTVTYNSTWSSSRIQSEINKVKAMIVAGAVFEEQKQQGIPVKLEYYTEHQLRLSPTVDNPIIALPDNTTATLPNTGIILDISSETLSTETLYYVWLLNSVNGLILEINTDSPSTEYNKLKTSGEGTTKILVGYMGVSSSNSMSGDWNVFSVYGETEKIWSTPITTYNNPTFSLPGICVAPGKTAVVTRQGYSGIFIYWRCSYNYNQYNYMQTEVNYGYHQTRDQCLIENLKARITEIYETEGTGPSYHDEDGYYIEPYTARWTPWSGRIARNIYFNHYQDSLPDTCPYWPDPPLVVDILFNHESFNAGVHEGNLVLNHTIVGPLSNWYTHGGGAYWHVLQSGSPYWTYANGNIVVTRQGSDW